MGKELYGCFLEYISYWRQRGLTNKQIYEKKLKISKSTFYRWKKGNIPEKKTKTFKTISKKVIAHRNWKLQREKLILARKSKKKVKKPEKVKSYYVTCWFRCCVEDSPSEVYEHYFSFYRLSIDNIKDVLVDAFTRHNSYYPHHNVIDFKITSISACYVFEEPFKKGKTELIYASPIEA